MGSPPCDHLTFEGFQDGHRGSRLMHALLRGAVPERSLSDFPRPLNARLPKQQETVAGIRGGSQPVVYRSLDS